MEHNTFRDFHCYQLYYWRNLKAVLPRCAGTLFFLELVCMYAHSSLFKLPVLILPLRNTIDVLHTLHSVFLHSPSFSVKYLHSADIKKANNSLYFIDIFIISPVSNNRPMSKSTNVSQSIYLSCCSLCC